MHADSGCLCYATINEVFTRSLDLLCIRILTRILDRVISDQGKIYEVTYFDAEIYNHCQCQIFTYVIPKETDKLILGKPWFENVNSQYSGSLPFLSSSFVNILVRNNSLDFPNHS